jgi:Flp pilus assembly protein TadD
MTAVSLALLDQAELLQLALTAGHNNDSGATLSYLKEAVSRPDASASAYFLLGSEYAEIRMYDRAVAAMEKSLLLDPSSAIVRLQLGLLLLSCGATKEATATLQMLSTLDTGDPLAQFGSGLLHLIRDEFTSALDCFSQGMKQNTGNPTLNHNMQRISDAIKQLPPEVLAKNQNTGEETQARHILLSAYTGVAH